MQEVTVVIPNLNGKEYIRGCLDSLRRQTLGALPVIIVDNGSTDGSREIIEAEYPEVNLIPLDKNYGFCRAVNIGIQEAKTEFVLLLNNDMDTAPDFAEHLLRKIKENPKMFSCQALLVQMDHPELVDDAGDFYSALGWALARGKGENADHYLKAERVFAACGGAAIYRKSVFDQIGLFDEAHFAYLEDIDIGYRANICGYENWIEPRAVVEHKGSAVSGSRYNKFKVSHSSRNSVYLVYKNMARWQILINLPFLMAGFFIKFLFFIPKGLAGTYLKGLWQGVLLARQGEKFAYVPENFDNCCKIQLELWYNLTRILRKK